MKTGIKIPKLDDFTVERVCKMLARLEHAPAVDLDDIAREIMPAVEAWAARAEDPEAFAQVFDTNKGARDLVELVAGYPQLDTAQIADVFWQMSVPPDGLQVRYRIMRDGHEVLVRLDCLTEDEQDTILEQLRREAEEAKAEAEALRRER